MLKIGYSPAALEDLQYIYDYVLGNWGENVAKGILTKITTDIRRLEQYPMMGVGLGKIIDVPTEYRYIFSGRNYIFYRLELDKIQIIRVLNEKQNYIQTLFGISIEYEE